MAKGPRPKTPPLTASPAEISASLRKWASEVGFDLVGIAPATIGLGIDRLDQWLAEGRQGEMAFMQTGRDPRNDPSLVMPGVKSLLVVGLVYRTDEPEKASDGGRVSRYAWGEDYHEAIRERLRMVGDQLRETYPPVYSRMAVDTAPVMEREYAQLAGLGWIGKNTLLLSRTHGSWLFLGTLMIDTLLEYDTETVTDHCGSCRRCLDACPTQAFDAPYQLDPRRCISYLTIEHKSAIPEPLREPMGDWIYGCDICQEVCPWNQKSRMTSRLPAVFGPRDGKQRIDLGELLSLDEKQFRLRYAGTSLFRPGRERLIRNAIVVAVNSGEKQWKVQIESLVNDPSPLLRESAQWALDQWNGGS